MPRAPKNSVARDAPKYKECDVCGAEFEKNSDLNRHKHRHSAHDDKPFKCQYPDCKFTATQKVGLIIHENAKHKNLRPHKCWFVEIGCEDDFTDPSARHRHMVNKHGYKPRETKPKLQRKNKAGASAQKKPYSRPPKAVKRSPSPTPELLPNVARKMSASPFFVDAPVAVPTSYPGHYIPEQAFDLQSFDYTFPVQQTLYTLSSDFFTPESQTYVAAPDYCIPESQPYTSYTPSLDYSTPSSQRYSPASTAEIATPSPMEKPQSLCWGDISALSDTASQALPHRDLYNNAIASYPQVLELDNFMGNVSLGPQPTARSEPAFKEADLKAWAEQSIREHFPPAAPWSSLPPSAVDFSQRSQHIDPYLLSLGSSF